jgi:competence protein ComEA
MVRHGRIAERDDRAATADRLAAMGLRAPPTGWVPSPVPFTVPLTERRPAIGPEPGQEPATGPIATNQTHATVQRLGPTAGSLARAWAADRLPPWAAGWVDQVRFGSVLMGVAALVAVAVAAVILLHHGSPGGDASSYDASAAGSSYSSDPVISAAPAAGLSAAPDATSIVVDVGGRVRKPGLVTLPAGARVADAIAAAGGPLHAREIATLDLAARVSDGQLLLIGVKTATAGVASSDSGGDTSSGGSAAPVSLSASTIDELETLPGVGPATAQKIIDWRTAHNGFTTVAQLQQVPGIGPTRYAELSPLVAP